MDSDYRLDEPRPLRSGEFDRLRAKAIKAKRIEAGRIFASTQIKVEHPFDGMYGDVPSEGQVRPEFMVMLGGMAHRLAPAADTTPREAVLLMKLMLAHAERNLVGDVTDWLAEHNLLRHFEVV